MIEDARMIKRYAPLLNIFETWKKKLLAKMPNPKDRSSILLSIFIGMDPERRIKSIALAPKVESFRIMLVLIGCCLILIIGVR